MLTACASGTTKTEAWKFDPESINAVKVACQNTYPDATEGTIKGLWDNKRSILRQSRNCSEAANILADQAENRNKVIGN